MQVHYLLRAGQRFCAGAGEMHHLSRNRASAGESPVITTPVEHDLTELLQRAGAEIRGRNRADCPRCGGKRTVSYTEEVFCCHHAGCDFRGKAFTLAKALGLARSFSPAERRNFARQKRQAQVAAEHLYQCVRSRRRKLNPVHRDCLDMICTAHECGPDSEASWDALATAYKSLPEIRAELMALEDASASDALQLLDGGPQRERLILLALAKDDGPAPVMGEGRGIPMSAKSWEPRISGDK